MMKRPPYVLAIGSVSLLCVSPALARNECDPTLFKATLRQDVRKESMYSLASMLSEEDYNTKRKDVGASGVIYGVPASANYGEYKQNVRKTFKTLNIDQSDSFISSYATSAIDNNGLDAYKACLARASGLEVTGLIREDDYKVVVSLHYPGEAKINAIGARVVGKNVAENDLKIMREELKDVEPPVHAEFSMDPADPLKAIKIDVAVGQGAKTRKSVSIGPLQRRPARPDSGFNLSFNQIKSEDGCGTGGELEKRYGRKVLHSPATGCTARWEFLAMEDASYKLKGTYGAAESRPVEIRLNGKQLSASSLATITGANGFTPGGEKAFVEDMIIEVERGWNIFEIKRSGAPFPHILDLRLELHS